jgi:hypothetical protein
MKDNRKEYDSFVFYGSWRELLEGFDNETAKEILWQVMLYGTDGEITTQNKMIKGIILGAVAPNIRRAMDRYNKAITDGGKGGRSKIELPMEEIIKLREKGTTLGEIARLYECSVDTVSRRIKEYSAEPQNRKTFTAKPHRTAERTQNLEKEIEIEREKEDDGECSCGLRPPTTTKKKREWNF